MYWHLILSFVAYNDIYFVLLLVSNLGFVGVGSFFTQTLDLWTFSLPNPKFIFTLIVSVAFFTAYNIRLPMLYSWRSKHSQSELRYLIFQLLTSIALSFVFVFLRQSQFAWVGGTGILLIAYCYLSSAFCMKEEMIPNSETYTFISFSMCLVCVVLSIFIPSNLLYLLSCICLAGFMGIMFYFFEQLLGCCYAIILILVAVPFSSHLIIVIGGAYVIAYLTMRAKDSISFSIAMILLGLGIIGTAVLYQLCEAIIKQSAHNMIPDSLSFLSSVSIQSFWEEGNILDWSFYLSQVEFTVNSFISCPFVWVLWPGALTFALLESPDSHMTLVCTITILLLVGSAVWMSVAEDMLKHLDSVVQVIV